MRSIALDRRVKVPLVTFRTLITAEAEVCEALGERIEGRMIMIVGLVIIR